MLGGGGGQAAAMSPAPGYGKRGRGTDAEEDVYVDSLHSHKRYLTEMMASSMNGLSVGDSVADNIIGSPVRLENISCTRDEMITQYSPVSEESDDYYDTQLNTNVKQTDILGSPSTSPVSSPHRSQKLHAWFSSVSPWPLPSCSLSAAVCSPARHGCGTEHEGRIPSSPNDMCHGGDLRRTALLRSVQIRVERPNGRADKLGHDQKQGVGVNLGQRLFSCPKLIQVAEYQSPMNCDQRPDHDVDFVEDQIAVNFM